MTSSTSLTLHWRIRRHRGRLEVVDGIHKKLGYFQATPAEMDLFEAGTLIFEVPGCCILWEGDAVPASRFVTIFEGEPRNWKHLEQIFDTKS